MLAFTRARKRSASSLDAPSTPVKAQRSMAPIVDNVEFHDGLAALSPPVTPIKGTPVRVDPVVKVRFVRSCAICARLIEASGRNARSIVVLWEAFLGWTSARARARGLTMEFVTVRRACNDTMIKRRTWIGV